MSNKYKLRCNVTGLWYAANANRKAALLKKFGTEEALREKYVSREGIRLQREGLSVEEIQKRVAEGNLKGKATIPAPSKRGRKSTKTAVKPNQDAPVPVAEDKDVDPDVKAFLATADASNKAV